ncbi:hypothetical protein LOTGIDRAFT_176675, partial [Lottia gigantea]
MLTRSVLIIQHEIKKVLNYFYLLDNLIDSLDAFNIFIDSVVNLKSFLNKLAGKGQSVIMGTIGFDSTHAVQNVTAIWILINQLSPAQRHRVLADAGLDEQTLALLLDKMHVKDYEKPMMQYAEFRI